MNPARYDHPRRVYYRVHRLRVKEYHGWIRKIRERWQNRPPVIVIGSWYK